MSTHASNFKVGLFVILGLALGIGAIAWLGASQYLKGAEKYVTFFNESVQGLQNDSTVRYRGVDVGRVKAIRVAPDTRLIEVIMEIQFQGDLSKELVAQLSTAGITGITFIELDRKKPGEKDLSPKIDFVAEYPIIPSRPSELQRIVSTLDNVMQQVQTINFKQMGQRLDKTLQGVEKLFTDKRLQVTLERVADASVKVDELVGRVDRTLNEKALKGLVGDSRQVLAEAKAAVVSAKGMVDQLAADIKKMDLGNTGKRAGRLFEGLEQRSYQLALEAQLTMQNLREASENMKDLLRNLERDPSTLIFSRPQPTAPHQEGRQP
ncbi:MAG: MlaD family protein [Desulfarculaceae bacterium]|nr:MlaD family protein [Desulfarculaceae bacterium]MCF8048686.1 MlaD family protein [Desulfarculaceae bacterium]MCF8066488.1 MlaD family protein [Desulfarculaceae bacterium]MCF8096423.1 MlaD family protein [Desulfarculaceae bacterium]MCF8121898.1 MlaD family protein [Desulfarculaceae bacterium]